MVLVVAVAAGCGPRSHEDACEPPDGAVVPCGCEQPLEVGRCVREDGTDCNGCEVGGPWDGTCSRDMGAVTRFAPLSDDDPVRPGIGPTGMAFIYLAARATGIDPGETSEDWPSVDLGLFLPGTGEHVPVRFGGSHLSYWLLPDVEVSGAFTVFMPVVVEDLERGGTLVATVRLRDRNSERRCGTADVVVER